MSASGVSGEDGTYSKRPTPMQEDLTRVWLLASHLAIITRACGQCSRLLCPVDAAYHSSSTLHLISSRLQIEAHLMPIRKRKVAMRPASELQSRIVLPASDIRYPLHLREEQDKPHLQRSELCHTCTLPRHYTFPKQRGASVLFSRNQAGLGSGELERTRVDTRVPKW